MKKTFTELRLDVERSKYAFSSDGDAASRSTRLPPLSCPSSCIPCHPLPTCTTSAASRGVMHAKITAARA
ncbi:hypothetical protein E2C01_084240 [Portunus trituberculatus]|uniref:Uncharacterized protein n=1 Tax=Portunus trituberculatus TaxID=210409 RepID=A0A5B7IXR7_PORTR|nr:hypothetical protein [Portunus trituberculatus]